MATLSDTEKRRESARKGQAAAMVGRTCPNCQRGNALSKHKDATGIVRYCRYCGYERFTPHA